MKKIILFIVMAGFISPVFAQQSSLIVFSENGERFQVVLNGILQNTEPETNVMITDLIAPSYKLKILFEDNIPDLDKTVYFQESNTQYTYVLKQNKKGEYVIRFQNSVPIAQALPPAPNQIVHVYSVTPPATTITHTQTTTTTNVSPGVGTNVNVNTNMNGVNINMNINETNVSSTSTTTTISTGTVHSGGQTSYVLPGYDGYYGCPYPISDQDFQMAKRSIESKDFSDSKVLIAKQVLDANCVLTSQVYQIVELFDFEDDRLEIAKYAYGSTLDVGNYFRINDAFDFESTIEELDTYIINYRW